MTSLRNAAPFVAILALLLVATPESGDATDLRIAATDLRGQIVSFVRLTNGYMPRRNVQVDLYRYDTQTRQWRRMATTYTDARGFYYLKDIPPNTYMLQVNRKNNYRIEVDPPRPGSQFQDIPPIRLT